MHKFTRRAALSGAATLPIATAIPAFASGSSTIDQIRATTDALRRFQPKMTMGETWWRRAVADHFEAILDGCPVPSIEGLVERYRAADMCRFDKHDCGDLSFVEGKLPKKPNEYGAAIIHWVNGDGESS